MKQDALEILEALMADAQGSTFVDNSRRAAEYLHSLSKMAGALARQFEQEADLIELSKFLEAEVTADAQQVLATKLAHHEQAHLAALLETDLTEFMVHVRCGSFISPKAAADSLRSHADSMEAHGHNPLFPAPMSEDELLAQLGQSGIALNGAQSPAIADAMSKLSKALGEPQSGD